MPARCSCGSVAIYLCDDCGVMCGPCAEECDQFAHPTQRAIEDVVEEL
jgi:hypothetical protein